MAEAAAAPPQPGAAGTSLWVPCFVFANVYALVFILKSLSTFFPKLSNTLAAALTCRAWRARRAAAEGAAPASAGGRMGRMGRGGGRMAAKGAGAFPSTASLASAAGAQEEEAEAAAAEAGARCTELRVRPVTLAWRHLGCHYYDATGAPKTVLKDVSGEARPGEMLAIMGHSGAGKSTLMDILAARKSVGGLEGEVRVNGRPRGGGFFKAVAYVPQDENLMAAMTVDETCAVHAALRMPCGTSRPQRADRIDTVLASMGLLHKRDQKVGGILPGGLSLRGLSGGERKRLWVAISLMGFPSILFLDEPTSGLDSCAALGLVQQLRERTHASHLATVASVHQPRAAIFACFDALTLLAAGRLIYHGPCAGLQGWLQGEMGYGPWSATVHGMLSDWAIDVTSIDLWRVKRDTDYGRVIESKEELCEAADRFAQHYAKQLAMESAEGGAAAAAPTPSPAKSPAKSPSGKKGKGPQQAAAAAASSSHGSQAAAPAAIVEVADLEAGGKEGGAKPEAALPAMAGTKGATWWTQFTTLIWREMIATTRNPADIAGRMLTFAYMIFIAGLVFWGPGATDIDAMRTRMSATFMESAIYLMMPFVYLSLYHADRSCFLSDAGARLYHISAYYAAKQLAVLPFVVVNTLASVGILYGMVGYRATPYALFSHAGVTLLLYLTAQQFHCFAVVATPNFDSAYALTVVWTGTNIMVSNFFIRFVDMKQAWVRALGYLSAMQYAYSAYLRVQFEGAAIPCAGNIPASRVSLFRSLLPIMPQFGVPRTVNIIPTGDGGCVLDLSEVLTWFNLAWPTWGYALALLVYLIILHALTFGALLRLARKETR